MPQQVPARFFIDENLLPVGRALAHVRRDVVHPGHAELPEVPVGTDDLTWLAVTGAAGLVAITRDKRIRYRSGERLVLLDARARLVCLTGGKNMTNFGNLEAIVKAWAQLEAACSQEGPWVKSLPSNGSLRPTRLDPV